MINANPFSDYIRELRTSFERGDATDRVIFGEEYGRARSGLGNPHTTISDLQTKNQKSTISNPLVGGYPVCEKWLKDSKGRTLDYPDIQHDQKIVVALRETIRLMAAIDQTIAANGGWPEAFEGGGDAD